LPSSTRTPAPARTEPRRVAAIPSREPDQHRAVGPRVTGRGDAELLAPVREILPGGLLPPLAALPPPPPAFTSVCVRVCVCVCASESVCECVKVWAPLLPCVCESVGAQRLTGSRTGADVQGQVQAISGHWTFLGMVLRKTGLPWSARQAAALRCSLWGGAIPASGYAMLSVSGVHTARRISLQWLLGCRRSIEGRAVSACAGRNIGGQRHHRVTWTGGAAEGLVVEWPWRIARSRRR
jgi:hypothetical protein